MKEAAAAVRWLLQQAEPEARRVAVRQIAKVRGREVADLLLRALGDEDWRVRKEAAAVAATVDHRDEVVAVLVAALEDAVNVGLRNAAVEALVAIGPEAVGAVVESLGRVDADARKLLVEVLGGIPDARGTVALVGALADEDSNVRVAAAEALGNAALAGEQARDAARDALVGALATSDTFQKIAALDSLARLEARLPWAIFEPLAKDPLLRRHAIAAAAASREPDAVRALAGATADASPTIARDAIVALGDVLAADLEDAALYGVVRTTLAATATGQRNVRRAALDAEDGRARGGALLVLGSLGSLGDVPGLVQALADDEAAERAELALRLFGPSVVGPLLESARACKSDVRVAAFALAASVPGAEPSVVRAALREGLQDPALDVRAAALEALGPVGEADDVRKAAALVGHEDVRVSAAATKAVSEIASRHVGAARALLRESWSGQDPLPLDCVLLGAIASAQGLQEDEVRLLERTLAAHDDPRVRLAAVDALARAGTEAASDPVVFALADEEHEVQLAAIRALGRLGRAEPLAGVVGSTRDPVLAAAALRALGDADPTRALDAARPLVTHADAAVACAAIEAVAVLREADPAAPIARDCEDALFAALDHSNREVIRLAMSVVGARPGARAMARLGLCLDHPSADVRRLAAELLGQDRSPSAQTLLRARLEREKDPIVREALTTAVSVPPADTARPSMRGE